MTRREALCALGSAAALAGSAEAQEQKFGLSAPKRTAPMLCAFSGNLARIPYAELGPIAKEIGYEGVDLTVMIGGHVDPRVTNVDLVRAFEMMRGSGLEVPTISTNIVSAFERTTYPVLYLTGHSQVPLFRLGYWPAAPPAELSRDIGQARQDIAQILVLAQRCGMSAMLPNRAGFPGETFEQAEAMIQGLSAAAVGYEFDPSEAGEDWENAFRKALPRLKAISLQDFTPEKTEAGTTLRKCPMGEGAIDWVRFFDMAARARFTGPISIHMGYKAKNEPGAMAKDLEFARKQVERAWTAAASHT